MNDIVYVVMSASTPNDDEVCCCSVWSTEEAAYACKEAWEKKNSSCAYWVEDHDLDAPYNMPTLD